MHLLELINIMDTYQSHSIRDSFWINLYNELYSYTGTPWEAQIQLLQLNKAVTVSFLDPHLPFIILLAVDATAEKSLAGTHCDMFASQG